MISAITIFLMNRGLLEATAQRIARWIIIAIAVLALIVVIVLAKSCYNRLNPPPKLNEAEIKKAQDAIAAGDRKALEEVLTKHDLEIKQIDGNLSNAETVKLNTLAESRKKYSQMTDKQLQDALEEQK